MYVVLVGGTGKMQRKKQIFLANLFFSFHSGVFVCEVSTFAYFFHLSFLFICALLSVWHTPTQGDKQRENEKWIINEMNATPDDKFDQYVRPIVILKHRLPPLWQTLLIVWKVFVTGRAESPIHLFTFRFAANTSYFKELIKKSFLFLICWHCIHLHKQLYRAIFFGMQFVLFNFHVLCSASA